MFAPRTHPVRRSEAVNLPFQLEARVDREPRARWPFVLALNLTLIILAAWVTA